MDHIADSSLKLQIKIGVHRMNFELSHLLTLLQTKTVQLGVLHGGLLPCSNVRYPAIYTRLDHPEIHAWLLNQIKANGKCLLYNVYLLWDYRLWTFKASDTKLERFLHKSSLQK